MNKWKKKYKMAIAELIQNIDEIRELQNENENLRNTIEVTQASKFKVKESDFETEELLKKFEEDLTRGTIQNLANRLVVANEEIKALKEKIELQQAVTHVQYGGRAWGKTVENKNWLQTSVYKADLDKLTEENTRLKLQRRN